MLNTLIENFQILKATPTLNRIQENIKRKIIEINGAHNKIFTVQHPVEGTGEPQNYLDKAVTVNGTLIGISRTETISPRGGTAILSTAMHPMRNAKTGDQFAIIDGKLAPAINDSGIVGLSPTDGLVMLDLFNA